MIRFALKQLAWICICLVKTSTLVSSRVATMALPWHAGRCDGTAANQRWIQEEEQWWMQNSAGASLGEEQKRIGIRIYIHAYTQAHKYAHTYMHI